MVDFCSDAVLENENVQAHQTSIGQICNSNHVHDSVFWKIFGSMMVLKLILVIIKV